ncbi:MAG: hypothetical protein HZB25_12810 [Candidatus Eisenbacteria bacterium]|nr:hypothetical protein [Candidatus Eisenbacteria bacterium]
MLPDLPACACFVGGGAWPLPAVAGNLISTARKSVNAQTSCLKQRGQPYWQIQLQLDDPNLAHFLAHWAPGIPNSFRAQAWCTETVAFWHREAQVPYPGGYFSFFWPSSYVQNTKELRVWYQNEEALRTNLFLNTRGRWINGSQLDYANFQPGVNGPCPGAFQAWESYDTTAGAWTDSCYHSQVVDSVVVWRQGSMTGPINSIDVHVVEGNAGGGTFTDINGVVNVSRGKVKNDKWYRNVIQYTRLGSTVVGCGNTVKKIRGWGIDLHQDGSTYCDPGRMTTVVTPYIVAYPAPISEPDPDVQLTGTFLLFYQASGGGTPAISTNASSSQTGGTYPTTTAPWTIPAGPLGVEPAYIQVDLKADYPLPVRGVTVDWEGGFAPAQYQVWWGAQGGSIHTTTTTPTTGLTPPSGVPPMPAYTALAPDSTYTVRYLRLVFSNSVLTRQFKIAGLHFRYQLGREEDNGDVFQDATPPVDVGEGGDGGAALLRLHPGVPNPFRGSTLIRYQLGGVAEASLAISDAAGRRVRTWHGLRGAGAPGAQVLRWDGRDASGRAVPAGVYVCELSQGASAVRQKLVLLR